MPDEPIKHLLRVTPPWDDRELTQCGRRAEDVAATTTPEAARAFRDRHGRQRMAFTHCMTCIETYSRWGATMRDRRVASTWQSDPLEITRRWLDRYINDADRDTTSRILHALGALVEAHRDEFDAMVTSQGVTDLNARRRTRQGLPR